MNVRLTELLEHVLDGEPELGDEVDAVFRRAERLRRNRVRALLAGGVAVVAAIAVVGYVLAARLMPTRAEKPPPPPAPSAAPRPSPAADPVLEIVAPLLDGRKLRVAPGSPERGDGWRRYPVVDEKGKPRGTVEIAVYAAAKKMCFPVLADPDACARPEHADGNVEYLRYDDDQDVDRQVRQTTAHRRDGRTLVVMAAGQPDTGKPAAGKPALTGSQVQKLALNPDLMAAFAPSETCKGASTSSCPVFRVPVPGVS